MGKSTPELLAGWEGLNHRDLRLADRGNQFSGEPADQGVCAGNGYVLESVNSAIRVYTTDGAPASPVLSLNQFYGFPSAFVRPAGPFGPFTFDISCHYDPDSDRWFHLAVDLDQDPVTGDFTGRNYLDLAVSTSGDPLSSEPASGGSSSNRTPAVARSTSRASWRSRARAWPIRHSV